MAAPIEIKVGLDTSELKSQAKAINSALDANMPQVQATGKKIGNAFTSGLDSSMQANVRTLRTRLTEIGESFLNLARRAGSGISNIISNALGVFGGNLLTGAVSKVTGALTGAVEAGFQYNKMLETTKITLEVVTGSAATAEKQFKDLQEFALKSPFQFPDLLQVATRLQAMGFEAKNLIPTIRAISNAASAAAGAGGDLKETLSGVALALGQMRSKGVVATEELNQLAERGIPAFDILSKKLGVTEAQFRQLVEAGVVKGIPAVEALLEGFEDRFGNLSDRLAATVVGKESNLQDILQKRQGEATKSAFEAYSKSLDTLNNALSSEKGEQLAKKASEFIKPTVNAITDAMGAASQGDWEKAGEISMKAFFEGMKKTLEFGKDIIGPPVRAIIFGALTGGETPKSFNEGLGISPGQTPNVGPGGQPLTTGEKALQELQNLLRGMGIIKAFPGVGATLGPSTADLFQQRRGAAQPSPEDLRKFREEMEKGTGGKQFEQIEKLGPTLDELNKTLPETNKSLQLFNERIDVLPFSGRGGEAQALFPVVGSVTPLETIAGNLGDTLDETTALAKQAAEAQTGAADATVKSSKSVQEWRNAMLGASTATHASHNILAESTADFLTTLLSFSQGFGQALRGFLRSILNAFAGSVAQGVTGLLFGVQPGAGGAAGGGILSGLGGGGSGGGILGGILGPLFQGGGGGFTTGGFAGGPGAGGILSGLGGGIGVPGSISGGGGGSLGGTLATLGGAQGGAGGITKLSGAAIARSLGALAPVLGVGLGVAAGGTSRLGQVLGGIGGGIAGLTLGVLTGALAITGTAAIALAVAAPFAVPLLIGAILLARASARKKDEALADSYWKSAADQIVDLTRQVQSDKIDGQDALLAAMSLRSQAVAQIQTIKTASVRESRLAHQIPDLDRVYIEPLKRAVEAQARRRATGQQLIPEFATGGYVSGIDTGRDSVLAMVRPGEVILNREQQARLGGAAAFRLAGVPGMQEGGPVTSPIAGAAPLELNLELWLGVSEQEAGQLIVTGVNTPQGQDVIVRTVKRGQKNREL